MWYRPVSVLLLCSGLVAQTTATFPPGFLSTEGESSSLASTLGTNPGDYRTMLLSDARGQRFTMKEIAFRPDYRNFRSEVHAGRSWSKVDLKMAEADTWIASTSFNQRLRTPQTLVFSGPVTWPDLTSLPPSRPAPFSLRFPFRAPWSYTGSFDVAADFDFDGGKLAWGTDWSYPLDFEGISGIGSTLSRPATPVGLPFCRDTRIPNPALLDSRQLLRLQPYFPRTGMSLDIRGANLPDQPAILAIGVAGDLLGTTLPIVTCQRLHVDLTRPVLYVPVQARQGYFSVTTPYGPITHIGASYFAQAIWNDSITGEARLTPAVWQHVFDEPRGKGHVEMAGYGDSGGIYRYGAPLYRYAR